jgi:hypothetical protein
VRLKINKPIIILGNIRSGTTILYDLLAVHPEVCWFSNFTNRFPESNRVILSHRMLGLPLAGHLFRRAISRNRRLFFTIPWPDEGDDIYHAHCGFGADKDGVETTLTEGMQHALRQVILRHLKFAGKDRFMTKQTANNRRIDLLHAMFPDAYYIHMIRDGRAVANSTLRVPWWNDTHIWWLGHTAREWERQGREPAELAGMHWKRTVEEVRSKRQLFGNRYIEVRYEDLVRDTRNVIGTLTNFCELRRSRLYVKLLPAALPNSDVKWRDRLTERQKDVLHDSIGDFLNRLGYTDR